MPVCHASVVAADHIWHNVNRLNNDKTLLTASVEAKEAAAAAVLADDRGLAHTAPRTAARLARPLVSTSNI